MSSRNSQYTEALEWLFAQLPFYQNQGNKAFKPGLDNIRQFTAHLGNPQNDFPTIHVAGTNGKGSTSHMIAAILQQANYKVGLYTSPHLKDFRERIKINGQPASKCRVAEFICEYRSFCEQHHFTFFEVTVAMAFWYFAKEEVDIAIIEVGMGGRLDATNIIVPEVAAITNISLDHTQYLGSTRTAIATEKAGIIKANIPVVIGEKDKETATVFSRIAKQRNALCIFKEDLPLQKGWKTDLVGDYQQENAELAQAVIQVLKGFEVSREAVQLGLQNVVRHTQLLGRWQQLQKDPKVILDVSHNQAGFSYLQKQLQQETYEELHLILGFVKDKSLAPILQNLPLQAKYYLTQPLNARALPVAQLAAKLDAAGFAFSTYNTPQKALGAAKAVASKKDLILVTGSNFIIADLL